MFMFFFNLIKMTHFHCREFEKFRRSGSVKKKFIITTQRYLPSTFSHISLHFPWWHKQALILCHIFTFLLRNETFSQGTVTILQELSPLWERQMWDQNCILDYNAHTQKGPSVSLVNEIHNCLNWRLRSMQQLPRDFWWEVGIGKTARALGTFGLMDTWEML